MRRWWLVLSYYVGNIAKTWMHTWKIYPSPAISQMWLSKGFHVYQERCGVCGELYWTVKDPAGGKCRRNLRCYLAGQVQYVTRHQPSEHVKQVRPQIVKPRRKDNGA